MIRQLCLQRPLITLIFAYVLVNVCTPTADAAKRVALVVGNSEYANAPLRNPSHDADDIATMLGTFDFDVTKLKDVTREQFEAAVDRITDGLNTGDTCMIFYAGHGVQLEDENYLIPIGVTVEQPQHVKQRCVGVSYLLDALEFSDCSLKIVIVDACRNNPFRGFRRSRSGLAELKVAPEGTIVSFSTSPKTAALDGQGRNSPFAKHLVKTFKSRGDGTHIIDLFLETSQAVRRETGQRPFLRLDASMPKYYLRTPPPNSETSHRPSMASSPAVPESSFPADNPNAPNIARVLLVNRATSANWILHYQVNRISKFKLAAGESAAVGLKSVMWVTKGRDKQGVPFELANYGVQELAIVQSTEKGWADIEVDEGDEFILEVSPVGREWRHRKLKFDEARWDQVARSK